MTENQINRKCQNLQYRNIVQKYWIGILWTRMLKGSLLLFDNGKSNNKIFFYFPWIWTVICLSRFNNRSFTETSQYFVLDDELYVNENLSSTIKTYLVWLYSPKLLSSTRQKGSFPVAIHFLSVSVPVVII